MGKKKPPSAPKTLGARGRNYWRRVTAEFALEPCDLALLQAGCEQIERADSAREVISKDGVAVIDRFGQSKPHPLIDVERQAQMAFVRIIRELGLSVEVPESRTPYLRGTR